MGKRDTGWKWNIGDKVLFPQISKRFQVKNIQPERVGPNKYRPIYELIELTSKGVPHATKKPLQYSEYRKAFI